MNKWIYWINEAVCKDGWLDEWSSEDGWLDEWSSMWGWMTGWTIPESNQNEEGDKEEERKQLRINWIIKLQNELF